MGRTVIIDALSRAGATFECGCRTSRSDEPITKNDMYMLGLSGGEHSARKRRDLLARLGLPERLPPNSIPGVLSALYTRDEFFAICSRIDDSSVKNRAHR
jgi:ribonuclease M5